MQLQGTSTGTTTINGDLTQSAGSGGPWAVSLQLVGPGTWAFGGNNNLLGGLTATSGKVVLTTNSVGSPGAINTPTIALLPGVVFDVSYFDPSGMVIGAAGSQTLKAGRTNAPATDIIGSLHCGSGSGNLDIAGVGIPGTLTISSNFTPASGTIFFDLSNNAGAGSGTNDLIVVGGGLDLSQGTATVGVKLTRGSVQMNTPYTLIKYSGALVGTAAGLTVPSPARAYAAGVVSTATPGKVTVTFGPSGLPPANLVWQGNAGPNWDVGTTYNWLQHNTNDVFFNGDNVTFDDTTANQAVSLNGSLSPTLTTVSTTNLYTFSSTSGGAIVGGTLTKSGSGELSISTVNLYSDGTLISAGTISAYNSAALGSGAVVIGNAASATNPISLLLGGGATCANSITVSSNGTGQVALGRESGGSCTFSGAISLQRGVTLANQGPATSNSRLSFTSAISGTGDVVITGGGLFSFYGINTFLGNVFITEGTDANSANNATDFSVIGGQAIPDTASVNVASNTLFVIQSSEVINALTGGGTVEPNVDNTTLTVGGGNGSGTFSGILANSPDGVYAINLTKAGTGTQILTGDNSLCWGNTTVSQGILAVQNVTGSGLSSGSVNVGPNGTLAGNGVIYSGANTVTMSGVLSVGNAGDATGASLTFTNSGSLSFNAGGALSVDIFSGAGAGDNTANAAAADVLVAQCAVTINAGAILNVGNPKGLGGWAVGDKWRIINWSAPPAGSFSAFNLPVLSGGLAWDVSNLYATGVIAVMARPAISVSRRTLSWPGSATLQSAPEATGVYTNVPGATSPFVITNSSAPRMFYRLRVP